MRLVRAVAPLLALASAQAFAPAIRRSLPAPQRALQRRGAASDATTTSLGGLTVPALKELLRGRGLPVGGRKAELLARLGGADLLPNSAVADASGKAFVAEPRLTSTRWVRASFGEGGVCLR